MKEYRCQENKTVIQVAHITQTPGPVQFLADYLVKEKGANFYQIYHPLNQDSLPKSFLAHNQKIIKELNFRAPALIRYFLDTIITSYWLLKLPEKADLGIGMNCFDTLPLIFFRKKIKKIIFFNTDFSRKRFNNPLINSLYVKVDQFCAKKADLLCCNTQRTIRARASEGVDKKKLLLVPNGVFLDLLGKVSFKKIYKKSLFYAGYISKEHGLQAVIKLLPKFNISLVVAGGGEYENELKQLVKKLKLESKVKFLGKIKHEEVIEKLKEFSGFGLAPYNNSNEWTKYCDPVKVKEYLSCFVPVIISDVPEVAHLVKKKKLGFVYESEKDLLEIIKLVIKMKPDEYRELLNNIENIRESFDLKMIYEKIWQEAFPHP